MNSDHTTARDEKIADDEPSAAPASSVAAEVEDAAGDVGKPASEPVERTAELLQAELEVSKAGITAPTDKELPLPR